MDRRRVLLVAVAAVAAGCAGLGLREPLDVNLVGLEPLEGQGMEARFAAKIRVQNPNDAAIDFDGISLTLDVRGERFATGVSDARGTVPRFGEAVTVVRRHRFREARLLVIIQADGTLTQVPEWMVGASASAMSVNVTALPESVTTFANHGFIVVAWAATVP
jgi:hypothetical protein